MAPGIAAGMRMRRPRSPLLGLMWLDPRRESPLDSIRHEAQQGDGKEPRTEGYTHSCDYTGLSRGEGMSLTREAQPDYAKLRQRGSAGTAKRGEWEGGRAEQGRKGR